jgi:Nif-specific regulatory protein
MRHTCEQIAHAGRTGAHVMLRGEPGTGKTLVARAIHDRSAWPTGAFVTVNCSAVPDLAVDGWFLGAPRGGAGAPSLIGYVERAAGGTLLLDEVADLGPLSQARLLVLAEDQVLERRDGSHLHATVRLVAASSRNLDEAVAGGRLRRDLVERLSACTIVVPPLRERKADIQALAALFVEKFAREHVRQVNRLSARALDTLMSHDWPGNVRELSHALERAVVLANGPVIQHHHLPAAIQEAGRSGPVAPVALSEALDAYEKELLQDALKQTRGVRSRAARLLKTTERIFNYKLRKHGIDWRMFKVS